MTFRFALPSGCPQPLPLSANVFSRVFDVSRSGQLTRIPLYPDLGAIELRDLSVTGPRRSDRLSALILLLMGLGSTAIVLVVAGPGRSPWVPVIALTVLTPVLAVLLLRWIGRT